MEYVLVVLMGTITVLSYVGYVPQIVKLLKTKTSKGISASAWIVWIVSCLCGTTYSILLKRPELIVAYVSELLLSATIYFLIIKYRDK